jgi:peptide/nickel transport system permease protein
VARQRAYPSRLAVNVYIIRRIILVFPVMMVVGTFVFSLLHLAPGDPAAIIAGDYAQPGDIERIRHYLGLDQPIHRQFFVWVGNMLRGDFGTSIYTRRPVMELIAQRIEPTLTLATTCMLFVITVAIPMGIVAAWRAGSWVDVTVMVLAVLGFSFPVFWLGLVMIYVFSVKLEWLPVQGFHGMEDGFLPFVSHILLPTLSIGIILIALLARITRASVMETLAEDYVRTAYAKGLHARAVLFGHALRNAAVPIVTTIGAMVSLLISGTVVTETVFAIPGIGRLTVDAILHRDYPVIQAIVILSSGVYVFINLVIDYIYTLIDPRIRY